MTGASDDIPLFEEVSTALRDLQKLLRDMETTPEHKAELQRRLIAVTNSSKHDLATAVRRLTVLRAAIEGSVGTKSAVSKGETPPR